MDRITGTGRTVMGELIRQRGQTAEEFSEEAERFAREHGINATLSVRHVQRLSSGRRADGSPLGPLRPSTRRLLEALFERSVDELLSPAHEPVRDEANHEEAAEELRARLARARSLDRTTSTLLRQRLDCTRRLDRQFGAKGLLEELRSQIDLLETLMVDVLDGRIRTELAAILVDASTLAGWQSLDRGQLHESWSHYARARAAAREAASPALEAYASASQAAVLLDLESATDAAQLTRTTQAVARSEAPPLLAAWLAAAHGEALAATGDSAAARTAFDNADRTLPDAAPEAEPPFLVFDRVHLARWLGSSLAKLYDPGAVDVLISAGKSLCPTFTRAHAGLRLDLAKSYRPRGNHDLAEQQLKDAEPLVRQVGSARQRRRLQDARFSNFTPPGP